MTEPADWHEWLKLNPPPNLQALAEKYGGCGNVPPWAWDEWDAQYAAWEEARRSRLLGTATWKVAAEAEMEAKKKRRKPHKRGKSGP